MWFTLSAVFLSLLQAIDLFFVLTAVHAFKFNPIEVSVISTLWTFFFICGVKKAGDLTNKGLFPKALRYAFLSTALLTLITSLTLTTRSRTLLYVSYVLHALSLSLSRVTLLSFMFEYFDYTYWREVSVKLTVLTMFFEGLLLTSASMLVVHEVFNVFVSAVIASTLVLALLASSIPVNIPPLERRLFMIDRLLNKALSNLSFTESTPLVLIKERNYLSDNHVSAKSLYVALMGFILSSELYFTILPFILLNNVELSLSSILLIYGLGKVLSSTIIYAFVKPIGRTGLFIAVSIRFLAMVLSYFLLRSLHSTVLVLSLIYFTGVLIDSTLLNMYNEVTYGYGLSEYTGLKELSSLIGSATCGFVFKAIGLNIIPLGAFLLLMPFINIISKKR